MSNLRIVFAAILAMLSLGGGAALAAPACTCNQQTNGTVYCICVGDDGVTRCYSCDGRGQNCTQVRCN